MKIRLVFILVILLTWVMAGCSSGPATSDSTLPVLPASTAAGQTIDPVQTAPAAEWSPDGVISAGEYAGLRQYGAFSVHWRSDDAYVYIGLSARTSGWVAMALQPGSGMKDADMVLGFVKEGQAEILDLHCTDNLGTHPEDTRLGGVNNILASGGKEEGGTTTLEFKRELDTGDKYDISIKKGPNKIMWSYGSSDNPELKHRENGYGEINP